MNLDKIQMVKSRILNEHKKYAHKEKFFEEDYWAEMAARKIVASMWNESEVTYCSSCIQMTHTYIDGKCTKCMNQKKILRHCFWHGEFEEEKCPACAPEAQLVKVKQK